MLFDKANKRCFLEIKKCRDRDEASYKLELVDKENKSLDFAGFSVFVKGKQLFRFATWAKLIAGLKLQY